HQGPGPARPDAPQGRFAFSLRPSPPGSGTWPSRGPGPSRSKEARRSCGAAGTPSLARSPGAPPPRSAYRPPVPRAVPSRSLSLPCAVATVSHSLQFHNPLPEGHEHHVRLAGRPVGHPLGLDEPELLVVVGQ